MIWNEIIKTKHSELPEFSNFGLKEVIKMGLQKMKKKTEVNSDIAPKGWEKYLHRRGVVAKVKFVPDSTNEMSGVFQGSDCGILRLSLTFNPAQRGVATGLAWKLFRNSTHSANISALYSLSGQGKNYNFFANTLSNIVPIGSGLGPKLVHSIFSRVTSKPEELKTTDMASISSDGKKINKIIEPTQLFFVPLLNSKYKFSSKAHDIRKDLLKIKSGEAIYHVFALGPEFKNIDYSKYKINMLPNYLDKAKPVGKIILDSNFVASEFGDQGLLFRHEVHKK